MWSAVMKDKRINISQRGLERLVEIGEAAPHKGVTGAPCRPRS